MTAKMTRYTNADFGDDESVNSVQLNEGISPTETHIRYRPISTEYWKIRSPCERNLLISIALVILLLTVMSILLNVSEHNLRDEREKIRKLNDTLPCLNQTCIHTASHILEAMDMTKDPCDDFYEYSCGGWIKSNPVPDGKSNWGTFMKLEQQNQLVIKRVLDQPLESFKSKAEEKAKMYYESCVDTNDTIEAKGADPMLKLIQKMGGWSISNCTYNSSTKGLISTVFNVSNWNLQKTLEVVQNKYHVGAFFSYEVGEDDKNSTRHVLQIDQSGLALPTRDSYLNRSEDHLKILKAYQEYMTKVGVLLGGEQNFTQMQMADVIKFETDLANITTPDEMRRDEESLYHLMTIAELQEKAGFIDWRSFFDNALKSVGKKVTPKEPVVVYAPEYMLNLTKLIRRYQSTPEGNNTLNNYLVWQTIKSFNLCLSKVFRDAYKVLRVALMGSDGGEEPQWRYCVQDTNTVLGFAVGSMFVKEVFQPDSKAQAEQMINNVRNAFIKNFQNLKWMDGETRKVAIDKAEAISDMIGYPDFVKDAVHLDQWYENLTIRADEYFDNNLNINAHNWKKNLEKINEPVNRTTWSMVPSTVNAYYTPTKNQMVFPAGILQNPFYDPVFPDSLNYGAMGVVMGHELTHGFDDQGRQYDKNGNLNHWWKNETIAKFKKRVKCVVEQYNKYKINGKNINGNKTLGENIADNGGLKASYHAYLELMKERAEPKMLPGIPLNHNQLFFVAFAQVWCSTNTKEITNLEIEKDTHSPAKFRVIGAVSNLREFSDAFECQAESKMNPKNKCEVW